MTRKSELHNAALSGDSEKITALLRNGADIEERDRYGCTPLMTAVTRGRLDCVQMLLDYGADLHVTDNDGKTALHQAALYGKLEMVRLLVRLGANVNARDAYGGYTPLHLAAAHAGRQIVIEMCVLLLAAGAEVDARTQWGTTPLFSAAVSGRSDLVEFLMRQGAELDVRDTQGRTPLIFVAKLGFFSGRVEPLLALGAEVNAQDTEGRTALMYAGLYARQDLMKILLDAGANIGLQDRRGRTVLMYAAGEAPRDSEVGVLGRESGTHDLGANTAKWNPEKKALRLIKAYHARAAAVRYLRLRGASIQQQDIEDRTALDLALENCITVGADNAEVVAALHDSESV